MFHRLLTRRHDSGRRAASVFLQLHPQCGNADGGVSRDDRHDALRLAHRRACAQGARLRRHGLLGDRRGPQHGGVAGVPSPNRFVGKAKNIFLNKTGR